MGSEIKQLWQSSKTYRVLLTATVLYTVVRLVVQGVVLALMLFPEAGIMGGMPGWVDVEGPVIPDDLRIYLDAATHFQLRQDLYPQPPVDRMEYLPICTILCIRSLHFSWPISRSCNRNSHIATLFDLCVALSSMGKNLPTAQYNASYT